MTHETETDDAQKPQPKPTCNSLETWAHVEHLRLWRQSLDQAAEQLARTRSHFRFVSVLVWAQTLLLLAWIVAWCVRT
jgi:3-methyladenine DNA glycosylase AlkC